MANNYNSGTVAGGATAYPLGSAATPYRASKRRNHGETQTEPVRVECSDWNQSEVRLEESPPGCSWWVPLVTFTADGGDTVRVTVGANLRIVNAGTTDDANWSFGDN